MVPRLVPLLVVALAVGGLLVWLVHSAPDGSGGEAGMYPVRIVAPGGSTFWNGTVGLPAGATVLSALQEAARLGAFEVHLERQAYGTYVRGIGPYEETVSGGWNFCMDSGSGFVWVPVGAADRALHAGERVEWRWAEDGSEVC